MSKETGGPAFAQSGFLSAACQNFVSEDCGGAGMTLRDYFAAKAMQGELSKDGGYETPSKIAKYAYEIADAMLEARK